MSPKNFDSNQPKTFQQILNENSELRVASEEEISSLAKIHKKNNLIADYFDSNNSKTV